MILRINQIMKNEAVFAKQIYPVIAYKVDSKQVAQYLIYDEERSFSWISEEAEIIGGNNSDYYEQILHDEKVFLQRSFEPSFFTRFYLQGDDFCQIIDFLESNIIKIFLSDFSAEKLANAIILSETDSEQIRFLLKAFFLKATSEDINDFAEKIVKKTNNFCESDVRILIENLSKIKSVAVKNLFEEISTENKYSDATMTSVWSYLYE